MEIKELETQLQDSMEEAVAIKAKADTEARKMNEEESDSVDRLMAEFDATEAEIKRLERIDDSEKRFNAKMSEPEPKLSESDQPGGGPDLDADEKAIRSVPASPIDRGREARCGWRTFGEFAQGIQSATSRPDRNIDPRLTARAATTFGNELVGTDGGFAVPPEFATQIKDLILAEEGLLALCDQMSTGSNSMTIPISDDSPWSTSGVVAAWEGEGDAYADKKPVIKSAEVRLNKLGVNVPVTEELLEDAPALTSMIPKWAAQKMNHAIDQAIIQGSGAGQPQGILNAPCAISQAIEVAPAQPADTIVWPNIRKMWTRLYASSRPNAVWIANQDIEDQLTTMFWADDYTTPNFAQPMYLPAGNTADGRPKEGLMGRRVIFHQGCETLGDKGDLLLADLSQYLAILKTGGIRSDVSIHMYWTQDIHSFKFRIRIGGQPWWPTTLAARDGTQTYSPFINLAERA